MGKNARKITNPPVNRFMMTKKSDRSETFAKMKMKENKEQRLNLAEKRAAMFIYGDLAMQDSDSVDLSDKTRSSVTGVMDGVSEKHHRFA